MSQSAPKFKDKYEVGVGHVWCWANRADRDSLSLFPTNKGPTPITLKVPDELLQHDAPKYRITLEKVKDE